MATDTPAACPGCDRPATPGQKWCQMCILEANVMAAPPDEQLAAITRLEQHIRAEEREACARLAEQESDYCGVPIAELIRARNTP